MNFNSVSESILRRRGQIRKVFIVLVAIQILSLTMSIAVSSIAFGAAVILFLLLFITASDRREFRNGLEWVFLFWVIAVALMVVFALYPRTALHQSRHVLLIAVVYFIPLAFSSQRNLKRFVILLAGVTAFQSLIEMIIFAFDEGDRLGWFQHYMTAAGIKMLALLMAIPLLFDKDLGKTLRLVTGASIGIMLFALLLTQTRSSWMAFIAGVLLIGIMRYRIVLAALGVLLILVVTLAGDSLQRRIDQMFDIQQEGEYSSTIASNRTRLRMWETGWKMFLDHPVTGIGDGEVYDIYRTYVPDAHPEEGGHLHNSYVHVLATHGGVGFLAMTLMLGVVFIRQWHIYHAVHSKEDAALSLGALAAFTGFLVNAFAEHSFGDHEILVLVWTAVGISMAIEKASR